MYLDAHGAEIEIEEESTDQKTIVQVEARAPADPLGRSLPQKTAPSEVAPLRDGLQLYLAWIRDIPLLTREQVSELSATIDEQEALLAAVAGGKPKSDLDRAAIALGCGRATNARAEPRPTQLPGRSWLHRACSSRAAPTD